MSKAENTPWFKGWNQPLDVDRYNRKEISDKEKEDGNRRRRIEEIQDAMRAEEEQWFLWL